MSSRHVQNSAGRWILWVFHGFPWFSMVFRKSPGGLCLVSWGWLPDSSDNDQTLQHSWGFINQLSLSMKKSNTKGLSTGRG